jgi:hypothetical protein
MSAVHHRHSHRRSRCECRLALGRMAQKRLARWPHQNRKIQLGQPLKVRQNLRVLFPPLPESQPRVHHNPVLLHARAPCTVHRRLQVFLHRRHHVGKRRLLRPRFRRAPHVVQDQPGITFGRHLRQVCVERQPARIVKNRHSELQRTLGNLRFICIE